MRPEYTNPRVCVFIEFGVFPSWGLRMQRARVAGKALRKLCAGRAGVAGS